MKSRFAMRWNRVATVTGPVLPGTPGGPHLPPQPPSSPALRERKGEYETSDGRYVARPSPPTLRERKGEYETDDQRSVVPCHPIHAAGEEGGDERSRSGSALVSCRGYELRLPLSRAAGEGLGVRAACSTWRYPLGSGNGWRMTAQNVGH